MIERDLKEKDEGGEQSETETWDQFVNVFYKNFEAVRAR